MIWAIAFPILLGILFHLRWSEYEDDYWAAAGGAVIGAILGAAFPFAVGVLILPKHTVIQTVPLVSFQGEVNSSGPFVVKDYDGSNTYVFFKQTGDITRTKWTLGSNMSFPTESRNQAYLESFSYQLTSKAWWWIGWYPNQDHFIFHLPPGGVMTMFTQG